MSARSQTALTPRRLPPPFVALAEYAFPGVPLVRLTRALAHAEHLLALTGSTYGMLDREYARRDWIEAEGHTFVSQATDLSDEQRAAAAEGYGTAAWLLGFATAWVLLRAGGGR